VGKRIDFCGCGDPKIPANAIMEDIVWCNVCGKMVSVFRRIGMVARALAGKL